MKMSLHRKAEIIDYVGMTVVGSLLLGFIAWCMWVCW